MYSKQYTPFRPVKRATGLSVLRFRRKSQNRGFFSFAHAVALLTTAGFASAVQQSSLSPTFGCMPVSTVYSKFFPFTAIAALSLHLFSAARSRSGLLMLALPVHATYVPVISHYMLPRVTSRVGPQFGPLLSASTTDLPLVFITLYAGFRDLELFSEKHYISIGKRLVTALMSYGICASSRSLALYCLPHVFGASFLLTRAGLQVCFGFAYALLCPSWLLLLTIPSLLFTCRINPHMQLQVTTSRLNDTLHRHGYSLLERQESSTGYLSVLKSNQDQYQVLRCDHSLLGGYFHATPQRLRDNIVVPEPIYSIFTMLEAVRLMETSNSESAHPPSPQSALVIGLGVGTSAGALTAHGVNTTAVEIDPAVSDLASRYFYLPQNLTVVTRDAVAYAEQISNTIQYDFIIHDVFTGGAEPIPLFTREFLSSLKDSLNAKGSIAINYAGDLRRPSTRTIINTIFSVYGSCRLFRDNPPFENEQFDLANLAVFCRKDDTPWRFREPLEADFLGSQARRSTIPPRLELDPHEVLLRLHHGDILTVRNMKAVATSQSKGALDHWRVMRKVLPAVVWDNW